MAGRLSPTADLLRKSRLFSLPPTLSPPGKLATSGTVTESDSATLPFPIRAAIVTPRSSLAKGDWGLKRSLPSKSTSEKNSNPVVRIKQIDTFEHVTDFESAGDHVATLKKLQELFLPLSTVWDTKIPVSAGGGGHSSVFERSVDNTHQTEQPSKDQRFRFRGPWLAGLTDIEFDRYLEEVRKQKPEFLKRLRGFILAKRASDMRRKSLEQGVQFDETQLPRTLSDAEFETALRSLRANPAALGPEIYKFLDLATPPSTPNVRLAQRNWSAGPSDVSSVEYAASGPPKTHPSAGLSYLRTMAHMDNHPVTGPQQFPKPVQARVLQTKKHVRGNPMRAMIGVGGIVTEDSRSHSFKDTGSKGSLHFDPDIPGGAKYWVKPERAAIGSDGKIKLKVGRASEVSKILYGVEEIVEPVPDKVTAAKGTRAAPQLVR